MVEDLNSGGNIIGAAEKLAERFGVSASAEYDPAFLRLVEQEEGRLPSFIFFGDHVHTVEPFTYLLGFPDVLKGRIITSDKQSPDTHSRLRAIGSEMVTLAIPEFKRYILPVVLRDSDIQFLTCNGAYVIRRRENRFATNEAALHSAADFLTEPGSNLILFPSGFVNSKNWKRGIVLVMGMVQDYGEGAPENTFVVPVSCNNLDSGDYKRLFFRAALAKLGLIHLIPGREFDITFGSPVSVEEIMHDIPPSDAMIDVQKAYMLRKIQELQEQYYDWVKSIQMGEI